MGVIESEGPEDLPWLISFGEFVEGQTYQGHDAIAVRPAGLQGAMTTALNEALSLSLIAAAGEPAEEAAYAAFSVNGSAATLRLVVQEPGDSLVEDDFAGEGILYKALSGGSFDCRGEDPLDYEDSFRQVTGEDQAGLEPLVEFVCWVEESSDEEFAAGLEDRVDAASLARYLALHNLLLDFDDMTGPGQNYYLLYDIVEQRFTVVSWDLNLSWSGDPARGPFETGSLAVGGGPVRPQGGAEPRAGWCRRQGESGPTASPVPETQTPAEAMNPPGGMARPPADQGGPGVMGGNLLAERFLEVDEFRALYEEAYRALYRQLFADGTALEVLDRWAATLTGAGGGPHRHRGPGRRGRHVARTDHRPHRRSGRRRDHGGLSDTLRLVNPDLAARLTAAGVDPAEPGDPAAAWRRLLTAFGLRATLVDRYALEAHARGLAVADLPPRDREEMWREVMALRYPGMELHGDPGGDPVEVVPYDPAWPDAFAAWRDRLAAALGPATRRIEHVGSTAVPGLAAKPVIDIQVGVADVADEAAFRPALEGLGLALRAREPAIATSARPGAGRVKSRFTCATPGVLGSGLTCSSGTSCAPAAGPGGLLRSQVGPGGRVSG